MQKLFLLSLQLGHALLAVRDVVQLCLRRAGQKARTSAMVGAILALERLDQRQPLFHLLQPLGIELDAVAVGAQRVRQVGKLVRQPGRRLRACSSRAGSRRASSSSARPTSPSRSMTERCSSLPS